jgi:hypothetical protein
MLVHYLKAVLSFIKFSEELSVEGKERKGKEKRAEKRTFDQRRSSLLLMMIASLCRTYLTYMPMYTHELLVGRMGLCY